MIPDKIYVSNLIYNSWQYTIPDPDDEMEVEYIRKNALIEWAKKNNKWIDTEEGDYSLGYVSAMIDLIEKLNSM